MHIGTHRQPHQDHKLGARIVPGNIFRRIRLGVPQCLRFRKHRIELGASLHLAQDEIARAVQDSLQLRQAIPGKSMLQTRNDWDSAATAAP